MKIKIILLIVLPLVFSNDLSFGQNTRNRVTISGTVTDMNGVPIKGAAIFIDKDKTNVVTDKEGHYKIKVNQNAKEILIFTLFQGVSEKEINGRTTIDFILSIDQSEMAELEKTADSEAHDETDNKTGDEVDYQDLQVSSFQNIYDMIRGRFPGVQVSGTSIKIDGSSSLNVSTEPLFVVDGVIVNTIDNIDPQTVKSIEVLKGPEATLYGTRGSNGVIVITRLSGEDMR